ncbi:MAG: hypothetical protein H8D42_01785 [Candidatus Marinimicrobia bacterium]|nr:hypothetical protein [Candidatus Neomarinimicrobiota bacterium]
MTFNASLAAAAVGSFPHKDVERACRLVLECFPEIPFWPQLPAASLYEQMEIQFSEGLPCIVIDERKERMYFSSNGDSVEALERFFENYLADNIEYFAITEKHARGIKAIEELLKNSELPEMKYFKMHVTGPVSFGLSIVDENKRAIYYDDMFRDVLVKGMAMKARWQMRRFTQLFNKLICIIDEPILSAFGSSTYVSVHRENVVEQIGEVINAVHEEGGLAGIHCCGNTEWTIPIDAGVDIISFDAYEYGYSIALYPAEIADFLDKGGILAWGIIPTSDKFDQYTTDTLIAKYESLLNDFASKGIDKELLIANSLLTATCGTGSVPIGRAERIARETKMVSDRLRDKYRV